MRQLVLEAMLLREAKQGLGEDRVGFGSHAVWCLDGASSLTGTKVTDHPTDAIWLVEFWHEYLLALRDPPMAALGSLVRAGVMRSRECFQRLMERKGCLPVAEAFPSTCLSIVAVENDSLACWTLGDSLIAVLLNDGQLQLLRDDRVERFDVAVTVKFATALKQGTPPDEARKLVEPELLANRQRRNRTDGYFILADDLDAVSQAKMFHLPLSSVAKVFLCTDGLLQAVAPFGLFPNNEALCREILNGDAQTLSNLGERLEIAAGQDPNCVKYPRLKIIDDMAAISCAVTTTA